MPAEYRDDLLELCRVRFGGDVSVKEAKMMGHPGFKLHVNNKFFVFIYEDGLTIKLPPELYEETVQREEMQPFAPMEGRKAMGTWAVWTLPDAGDYETEWGLVEKARAFTATEEANVKKGRTSRRGT